MKIEFSLHAIALLDILGFSHFVEKAEKCKDKMESLEVGQPQSFLRRWV